MVPLLTPSPKYPTEYSQHAGFHSYCSCTYCTCFTSYMSHAKKQSHFTTCLCGVCVRVPNYFTVLFLYHLTLHATRWAYAPPVNPEVQSGKIETLSRLAIIPAGRKCRLHFLYPPQLHPLVNSFILQDPMYQIQLFTELLYNVSKLNRRILRF